MKSIFKKVSAAVMALAVAATVFVFNVPKMTAFAVTDSGNCGFLGSESSVQWSLNEDGVLTISGSGDMALYGYADDVPWKNYTGSIKKIEISEGITYIGQYAFYNCSNITDITIPSSVERIGGSAFEGCSSLKTVTFENNSNLTAIRYSGFKNCSALTNITLPDTIKRIEGSVFSGCKEFTNITIPSSVTYIDHDIFENCSKLKTVTFEGDLITAIPKRFFYNCSALTDITLPSSVTEIVDEAFNSCSALTDITLPSSVTDIGSKTFYNCSNINLFIPNTVTKIGSNAFYNCKKIFYPSDIKANISKTYGANALIKCMPAEDNDSYYKLEITVKSGYSGDINLPAEINGKTIVNTNYNTFTNKITHEGDCRCDDYCIEPGKCSICGNEVHTHTWGKWSITKQPTLTETGTAERVCSCGEKDTKTDVPKLNDTLVWTKGERKDPTLNGTGSQKYTSTEYGTVTITIPALTNTTVWKKGERTDPTLTGSGSEPYTSRDYGTVTITIPALTDSTVWTKGDRTDPTLTGSGSEPYTSRDYGTVTITIPALTDSTWKIDNTQHVDATEETDGKDVYESDVYGEVTVVIPALDHTHEWGDWEITKAPTSETEGTAKHVCTKNDRHTETKTLAVLTDTSVWTKVNDKHVDPTEQTEGKDVYTSEYGEVTVTIPKLNHTHTLTHVPEVPATETQTGVKEHWHCDGCNKDFADENGTKEVTVDELKTGKLKTKVEAPTNVPKPEIATSEENLIEMALTKDEQKELEKGTDITIILKVEDASQTVHPDDKGKVETAIGDLSNNKLGQYLDVTLLKKIGEREEKVTATNSPIKITFEIPESLRGKAEYSVIRVHGGTATILRDLDSDPNTVTIETDKFSTYALTYKEKTATSTPSGTTGGSSGSSGFNWSDYSNTAFDESTSSEDNSSDTASNASNVNNGSAAAPSGNENSSDGDNSSDTAPNGNENSSDGDNNSDTAPSENENPSDGDNNSNSNRLKIVSSGASSNDRSSKNPNESSSSENNGNPSTGFAVSLIPITATLAVVLIAAKRRRK